MTNSYKLFLNLGFRNLGTLLFDHKAVFIDFKTDKKKSKMFINRTIINNPRTADVVAAAAADTYLAHATPGQPDPRGEPQYVFHIAGEDLIEGQKAIVGQLLAAINNHNNKKQKIETEGTNNLLELELATLNMEIRDLREHLWDPETYGKLSLTCDDDVFLEVLMGNIKGSVVSFQSWVKKVDNARKSLLIKSITNLRSDFNANAELILEKERELSTLTEKEITAKVRNMKIFDCLNSEKPSPMFLSLARASNTNKKLSAICSPNGDLFDSERNAYFTRYFQDIYSMDPDERENF